MTDSKREILNQVAQGDLTPEEAEARLAELDRPAPGGGEGGVPAPAEAATKVRVVRIAGAAEIIGDPTVKEAVADGPHDVHREGTALVIESRPAPGDGYTFGPFSFGTDLHRKLRVRMNPQLALEAEIQAGSLHVSGLKDAIKADVQAGSSGAERRQSGKSSASRFAPGPTTPSSPSSRSLAIIDRRERCESAP